MHLFVPYLAFVIVFVSCFHHLNSDLEKADNTKQEVKDEGNMVTLAQLAKEQIVCSKRLAVETPVD